MNLERRWVYPVLVGLFFLIALAGSPFKPLDGTGHFYLSVLGALDPELFVGDDVTEGLGRFSSLFYRILAAVAGGLGAGPEHLEAVLHGLYVATRLASILIILALVRGLGWERGREIALFVLFAAWCSHVQRSPVGGVGLFDAAMTHREVVFVVLLGAVCLVLRRRYLGFWLLLGLSLFLHATRGMNFFFVTAPVVLYHSRTERRFPFNWLEKQALGLGIFFLCALSFYRIMAPSPLSAEDAEYFLALKNRINHVSPFAHSVVAWLIMIGVAALAILAFLRDLRSDRAARLFAGFVVSGAVFGLARGFQAVAYKTVLTTQLVPLRIFIWVWFFSFLLIAMAAVRHGPAPIRALLVGVVLLSIQHSLWMLAFAGLGIAYYLVQSIPSLAARFDPDKALAAAVFPCWLCMAVFWGLGERQPFEGFRDPWPVVTGLAIAGLAIESAWQRRVPRRLAIAGLLVVSLLHASHRAYRYEARYFGEDWEAWRDASLWCRENTGKQDRFITPAHTHSFRNLAFRPSLNELRSELVWVQPATFRESVRLARSLEKVYDRQGARIEDAFCVAAEWGADYVVTRAGRASATEPVYANRGYAVFRVPADACSAEHPS